MHSNKCCPDFAPWDLSNKLICTCLISCQTFGEHTAQLWMRSLLPILSNKQGLMHGLRSLDIFSKFIRFNMV